MSYHYHIEPSIVIAGDDLSNLKKKLDEPSLFGLGVAMSKQGYATQEHRYSPSELAELLSKPVEEWKYVDVLVVYNMGWTPEYDGRQGIAERFVQFVEFIGYNMRHGEYTVTDDYDRKVIITVADGECSITY